VLAFLYGESFGAATSTLSVLIWTVVPYCWVRYHAYVLVAADRQRIDLSLNVLITVLNVVLNLFLIPRYGHLGAAVSTLISVGVYQRRPIRVLAGVPPGACGAAHVSARAAVGGGHHGRVCVGAARAHRDGGACSERHRVHRRTVRRAVLHGRGAEAAAPRPARDWTPTEGALMESARFDSGRLAAPTSGTRATRDLAWLWPIGIGALAGVTAFGVAQMSRAWIGFVIAGLIFGLVIVVVRDTERVLTTGFVLCLQAGASYRLLYDRAGSEGLAFPLSVLVGGVLVAWYLFTGAQRRRTFAWTGTLAIPIVALLATSFLSLLATSERFIGWAGCFASWSSFSCAGWPSTLRAPKWNSSGS